MNILMMAGQMILALAILVSLHEAGHFLAARAFGIRVEKFYIFFDAWGKKLFSFKKGDTEYGIGWLPLGGYVKISGMIDESMDKEQMAKDPEPWEFRSKPAWQRLIVMIGGVVVNLILGIFIFAMLLFAYGDKYVTTDTVNENGGIAVTEQAEALGFQAGDLIVGKNGAPVKKFKSLLGPWSLLGDSLTINVKRNGEQVDIWIPDSTKSMVLESKGYRLIYPRVIFKVNGDTSVLDMRGYAAGLEGDDEITMIDSVPVIYYDQLTTELKKHKDDSILVNVNRAGENVQLNMYVDTAGALGFGIVPKERPDGYTDVDHFSFAQSFPAGIDKATETLTVQIVAFGAMIKGKINPTKSMMGPIQMAGLFGNSWDPERFWMITGLLSLVLAFMNLLPIPALDGGHVVFLIYEMIAGKPVGEKFMYVMQIIGMVILLSLMVFIFGNDIYQALFT